VRLALLFLVVAVAGCATAPPAPDTTQRQSAWAQRIAELSGQERWQLTARIAVRTPEDGWSASLRWRQSGDAYRVDVWGPLGRTLARLDGGVDGVALRTSDGMYQAPSPEQLLLSELGWQLPVSGMRHWIRGLPSPQGPVDGLELDEIGRPERLQQAGWDVSFPEYQGYGVDALPGRVVLVRDPVHIRLSAEGWGVPAN
jgi:outer membrane lipoprotein LolB